MRTQRIDAAQQGSRRRIREVTAELEEAGRELTIAGDAQSLGRHSVQLKSARLRQSDLKRTQPRQVIADDRHGLLQGAHAEGQE